MRLNAFVVAVLCAVAPVHLLSQSSNATLSGTVSDATGALIPGVDVTATNTATGVVSATIGNETGTYNLPSLLPGVYTVSAELPGFQTQTYTDVRLGNAAQVRLNFSLAIGTLATAIEVTVSADRLLLESSSSTGAILAEEAVQELPVLGNMGSDVLSLVRALPGVNLSDNTSTLANDAKFAGVSAQNLQVTRDGVDASAAGRWPNAFRSATVMNPDLVGEVRMVLAPVDAEVGRGNSQIQVQTRSGSNQFRGAAVWTVQNSALDPNTWANNRVQPEPATRDWSNLNEYTVSAGGPIVRNRTFFFALWNGLLPAGRSNNNPTILTPCARRGIFRYYDNWSNGSVHQITTSGSTPRTVVVDFAGNPVPPTANPDGTPHNGILRYASVFGPLKSIPTQPDCSDAIVEGAPWDPYRTEVDPTGYVARLFDVMPEVNNYEVGDGLNTAGHRWVESTRGGNNRFGIGSDNRKQINLKIDHNFNDSHKINSGYSFEAAHADYSSGAWPFRFPGLAHRQPQVLTVNFTSTLSPNVLNEVRFGFRRTGTNTQPGLTRTDEVGDAARAFVPNIQGIPVMPQLGAIATAADVRPGFCVCGGQPNMGGETGHTRFNGNITENTRSYTYADTLSWTRGTHAFKGGVEVRFTGSLLGDDIQGNYWSTWGRAHGGETALTQIQGINGTNMPGLQGTATSGNNHAMRSLLNYLSGSLSRVTQLYFLGSADRLENFDDYRVSVQRERELNQNEVSVFFKDDWKVNRELTLNLGVRWDYYGVPWVSQGLTSSPLGGGNALFGYSGRGFEDWMRPGQRGDLTELIFVGPDSPNPEINAWPKDWNNFGPAIGFAWQVPWFGAGQTTVRGGYQASFLAGGGGRFQQIHGALADPPGSSYQATIDRGPGDLEYLDLTDLASLVPVPVPVNPMEPVPVTARNVNLAGFDSNFSTPYVQNLTLAVTRNVGSNVTVDVRYIATLSRKLYGTLDLNVPNFLYNGLAEAFDAARVGGESDLLNAMFAGINIAGAGFGPVGTEFNGVVQTGAMHLRAASSSQLRNNLANGNYQALANSLSTLNYSQAGGRNAALPEIPQGENGAVLRLNGFPENFIKTNPQFGGVTMNTNMGRTNYHGLQSQVTLRPTVGVNFQASYTWSKLLGLNAGSSCSTCASVSYTNPADREGDYTNQVGDRRHSFLTNGTFHLPVGPGQLLAGNSSGILARVIEGWQTSWILNMSSGAPANILAQNMLYSNGVPDRVGPFDPSAGRVQWEDGAIAGGYFGNAYTTVDDPQCGAIAASLRSFCSLNAVADASGNIVLQNPQPGTRGNLGQNVLELPGTWSLDAAMSKEFQIGETRSLQFRLDALNLFNHPQPANPVLNINSDTAFGNIASKSGTRQFQFMMRLEF